jgi:hypothetical protein
MLTVSMLMLLACSVPSTTPIPRTDQKALLTTQPTLRRKETLLLNRKQRRAAKANL